MKRLLLPLLAALALPTAVNADTYSLMVFQDSSDFAVISNITFSTREACLEEGKRFTERNRWFGSHCFKGE